MIDSRFRLSTSATRAMALVVALVLATTGLAAGHVTQYGFRETFQTVGPLPAGEEDAWQVASGSWSVADIPDPDGAGLLGTRRVLMQTTRGGEALALVRRHSFRQFTAQATAAIMDTQGLQTNNLDRATVRPEAVLGSSVALAFRAPLLENGTADDANLYLFGGWQTGYGAGFPTGKAFILWKRIGRGYYMVDTKVVPTFLSLADPHEYKVVMSGGRMLCYVDGRLVIDYTDIPSPDEPTTADRLPGVPFDAGAVGVRSSVARVWYDDFSVVGTNAYEARAAAVTGGFSQHRPGSNFPQQGVAANASLKQADTGFQYHDHDFDEAIARPVQTPQGDNPSAGVSLRTLATGGTVSSIAQLTTINTAFVDPSQKVTVILNEVTGEQRASAACSSTGSSASITSGTMLLRIDNLAPLADLSIPIPLQGTYRPNTVLFDQQGVTVTVHATSALAAPRRVEAALLKVSIAENGLPATDSPIPDPQRPSQPLYRKGQFGRGADVDVEIGKTVAGRYCQ